MKNLLLILIITIFTACNKKDTKIEQEGVKTVFATTVKSEDVDNKRVLNGLAISNNETKLSFKVQGNVSYLKVEMGDEVKKGDLIAKLDSKPYELKVSRVKYILSEAKAVLENAKSSYERVKKLYINQNASVSDMDKARAFYDTSSAKVKNIQKELEYAKLKLSYTKLYSPMDGYISLKFIHENENVAIGTPIVSIGDKFIDEVSVQVPETIINKIKKEDKVKVFFPSLNKKDLFEAKIKEISKYTSARTKTYKVVVKLDDNNLSFIKEGMSADVYFNFSNKNENKIYFIPSNSVLNDKSGYFVYTLEKSGKHYEVKKTKVNVGKITSNGFEILNGLEKNSLVLKAGMSEVYENMKVQIGNMK